MICAMWGVPCGTRLLSDAGGQFFSAAYFAFHFPATATGHRRPIVNRGLANLHVARWRDKTKWVSRSGKNPQPGSARYQSMTCHPRHPENSRGHHDAANIGTARSVG